LVQAALHCHSLEAMYKLTKFLSADRVLDRIHKISKKQIEDFMWQKIRKLRLPKKVIIAMDFHDKEFFGDKNHHEVMGSKGGKYVVKYLQMSVVKPALFLGSLLVNQFNNEKYSLITKLIEGFYDNFKKTKIELLLLDRGFFTKDVVKLLQEKKIKFIMPAVKNPSIKKLVKKFEKGEIEDRTKYQFGQSSVYLTFIKIEKETFVFMTNTRKSPVNIHLLYKKRWQIETNFREQNNFLLKTKTKNFKIRYLAFILAGLIFNLWQMLRTKMRYKLENYIFKQFLP